MYTEYLIEIDPQVLMVYINGLTEEGFWIQLFSHEDVNNPEEFAEGYAQRMRDEGLSVSIADVSDYE